MYAKRHATLSLFCFRVCLIVLLVLSSTVFAGRFCCDQFPFRRRMDRKESAAQTSAPVSPSRPSLAASMSSLAESQSGTTTTATSPLANRPSTALINENLFRPQADGMGQRWVNITLQLKSPSLLSFLLDTIAWTLIVVFWL